MPPKKSGVWKWVLVSFLMLLVILICTLILASYLWKPYVSKKIKEAVSQSTKGLYSIDFSEIQINLLQGSARFDSLQLRADTVVFNRLKKAGDAPKHIFDVKLDVLSFTGIQLSDIYFKKELTLNTIVIDNPSVEIRFNEFKTRDEPADKKTAYQQLSKFLKSLKINTIVFKNADVDYIDQSYAKPKVTKFKGVIATVNDLRIDSASQFDNSRFYYTKDISLLIKNHQFITRDRMYSISLQNIISSTSHRLVKFSNLRVKPLYPEMEFSRKYKTQHDRYNLYFKEISLHGIDFTRLNTQRRLIASSLKINSADINIFMNRTLPPVTFDKGRNYPHVVLKRLKLNTRIDTLYIKNSIINYAEYNPKSRKKGTVIFNRFNATILNITNDSISLKKNHWVKATTSALLMNEGRIDLTVNFNLISPQAAFNFTGSIGKMDMRKLNELTRSLSMAEIKSGMVDKAEFKVSGDLHSSTGYIKLYYKDLKIDLLKSNDDASGLKKMGVVSALANTLVIKNNNPDDDGELTIGKTVATRLKSASFFNLMWNSLFAGIKETVVATLKEVEKQEVKPDKQKQRKLERKKRREERKKAREKSEK